MNYITKIVLINFKKFDYFEVEFDEKINLLIGDNEAGKSSILTAINLAIGGNRRKVEAIGLDYLFNSSVIKSFLNSKRKISDLPELRIELYINEQSNQITSGKNNTSKKECHGLRLICKPNEDYSQYIKEVLSKKDCLFPFEYYSISFSTFADISYNNYNRHLKHIFIDNSQVSSEYAMNEYVKSIYAKYLDNDVEKYQHFHEYRSHKEKFKNSSFELINERLEDDYQFAIKSNSKSNLGTDLTIFEGDIPIDNKGKGKQCLIKTELALKKSTDDLDVVLLEEPENHLSHSNVKKIIYDISKSNNKQIFIATHNNLISTRLNLRNSILLNSTTNGKIKLNNLPEDTAKFFIKAPDNNILEFILSKKVILVEGDAEYMLVDIMFSNEEKETLEQNEIHVISVGGTSFPRYLDIAKLLNIKTAVITDNDRNYQRNCVDRYQKYTEDNMKVFADKDENRRTFEICIYQDNQDICDELFTSPKRQLTIQDYMLKNKAEAAYNLLDKKGKEIKTPQYIKDAFKWIKG